jgi:subtilisin-like proprotein convertase family protein
MDTSVTPLSDLLGGSPNGTWTLRVYDEESGETGTVTSFAVGVKSLPDVPLEPTRTKSVSFDDLPLTLPDGKKKKTLKLKVKGLPGTLAALAVSLDVEHPRPQDLFVRLTGPDGTSAQLFNLGSGSAYGLGTTMPTYSAPLESLDVFLGKKPKGTWELLVKDVATGEVGVVRGFDLHLTTE